MSSVQLLREFINRRLTSVAVEICKTFYLFVEQMENLGGERRVGAPGPLPQPQAAGHSQQQVREEQHLRSQGACSSLRHEQHVPPQAEEEAAAAAAAEPEPELEPSDSEESEPSDPEPEHIEPLSAEAVRTFINRQLITAAVDIFLASEQTIIRLKQELQAQRHLLKKFRDNKQKQEEQEDQSEKAAAAVTPAPLQPKEDQEVPEVCRSPDPPQQSAVEPEKDSPPKKEEAGAAGGEEPRPSKRRPGEEGQNGCKADQQKKVFKP